ncbi:hypothetical protein A374_16318 [Fictibacillus macauensis ZFHKF-1]|uniref:Uncharacterized protein n=1 Tax=Fictibacillus macauensis ZFHKF-1 TaxID=1196324 RepID=I8UC46_9BACL|nr:hypothetical protein [Fictibacillus macauensis]EIT84368.1 hypothetical protein A374_16318 [Fictibacillus macauensis ZFHKF-1]
MLNLLQIAFFVLLLLLLTVASPYVKRYKSPVLISFSLLFLIFYFNNVTSEDFGSSQFLLQTSAVLLAIGLLLRRNLKKAR